MGSRLVSAAWAFVATHNERARLTEERELEITEVALLALMAHTARDDDAEPWFQTERAKICAQLGIRDTEAGRKRIQRALGALAAAGAIAPPEKYVRGFTPRYRLIYQGGRLASIPTPGVWTPGIPPTLVKGDAPRLEYGRLASPSVDAQHPPEEERGTKEEEGARATDFQLLTPAAPQWDADLPEPLTANDAARCPRHPTGTTGRCRECRDNREAWQASHPAPTSGRRRREPLRLRAAGGRRICDNRPHVLVDDGTCRFCDIHPDDLATELAAGLATGQSA